MANQTAWVGGALDAGSILYQGAFGSELNQTGFVAGASVLSSTVFDNTAGLDQFLDISFVGAFATAQNVVAGQSVSFAMAIQQADNLTMGDGGLTAGAAPLVYQPLLNPLGGIPVIVGSSITKIVGDLGMIPLRPRKFSLIITNNTLFTLASSSIICAISTYRQNMNA